MKSLMLISVILLSTLYAFSEERYRGMGIIKRIEGNYVFIDVKSDNCHGVHRLTLRSSKHSISVGRRIIFTSTANPCRYHGEVYITSIESPEDTEERE